ncbi:MAG: leucyl aminopeptidase family protein, partial [Boseongicola sp.]
MTPVTFIQSDSAQARPLHLVTKEGLAKWQETLSDSERALVAGTGFTASPGQVVLFPDAEGVIAAAAGGLGDTKARTRKRFLAARIRGAWPVGTWRFETDLEGEELAEAALGWLLAGYCFDRYVAAKPAKASLIAPVGVDVARLERIAAAEALTRDLINTPASDMGPDDLESVARALATEFGANIGVISGDDLLDANFPMIHAVGRASPRAPRLIDMKWGSTGPLLTLVGKGVCFDTGGLNLKPGASMGLMKKDMGG